MNTDRKQTGANRAQGKPKRTPKAPRQIETLLDLRQRVRSCDEVNLGFSPEQAQREALRCLNCVDPKCIQACPLHIDIRHFVDRLTEGDFVGALKSSWNAALFRACAGACASTSAFARTPACWGRSFNRWRLDRLSGSRRILARRELIA